MTRCYEFYCMVKKTPDRCEIEDRASKWRVNTYMTRFEQKGVKFDYGEEDKELFYSLHDEIGSEYEVGRVGDHQRQRAVECAGCGMGTYNPIEKKGQLYCSEKCAGETEPKPKPPSQRTEQKLYKETAEYRLAQRHPSESKMDKDIFLEATENKEIKEAGYHVVFQKEYILLVTRSDVTLEKIDGSHEKVVFLDHVKIHRNRRDRDAYLRGLLEKRYPHVKVVPIDYEDNTKQSKAEIMQEIVGAVKGEHQN
jgi:hypothetical protein